MAFATRPKRLQILRSARSLEDVRGLPSNGQWRICFRWHEGNAWGVEIVDIR